LPTGANKLARKQTADFPVAAKETPIPQNDLASDQESTRDRILDLAEDMFAKSGIDKVSLRAVTAAAGVNVSAIHYHFGSKDELLRAIFVRRLSAAVAERERRLLEFTPSGNKEADVRRLMEAYIEPGAAIDCADNNYRFSRLVGQLSMHDEGLPADMFYFVRKEVDELALKALSAVLPELTPSDLAWRLEFISPLMEHGSQIYARLKLGSRRKPANARPEDFLPQLISATVAIFCAPSTGI
jgi:AcrR family transcriptional regulator